MKVLHVIPSFYPAGVYGGPVRSVYALCRHLRRRACEVRVLTTDANGPDAVLTVDTKKEVVIADGVRVRYCPRQLRHSVSVGLLAALPRYVRWADVVHLTAVYSFPIIPTLLMTRLAGRSVVWSPRGALQRWRGSRRRWSKRGWERVCQVVAPRRLVFHATSDQEAADCRALFAGAEVFVVPNGVEVPDEIATAPGDGALRLLYLGRLDPIKGIENLLSACRRLADTALPWFLTIAGGGDPRYAEQIRARIGELGLAGRTQIIGEVTDAAKRQVFAMADVLVFPSYAENFGMVVAEALAHGVPVIASRGTPWSGVEQVGCGLWVDNSADALAAAIQRASRMPLREMGERGRNWVRRDFTWESVAMRMLAVYQRVTAAALGTGERGPTTHGGSAVEKT